MTVRSAGWLVKAPNLNEEVVDEESGNTPSHANPLRTLTKVKTAERISETKLLAR